MRLVRSGEPRSVGEAEALNISKKEMISENIPKSSELAGGDAGNKIAQNEDESLYSSVNRTPEEEHFDSDENLGFAADPLRRKESKWNDTTYYVAKKLIPFSQKLPFQLEGRNQLLHCQEKKF